MSEMPSFEFVSFYALKDMMSEEQIYNCIKNWCMKDGLANPDVGETLCLIELHRSIKEDYTKAEKDVKLWAEKSDINANIWEGQELKKTYGMYVIVNRYHKVVDKTFALMNINKDIIPFLTGEQLEKLFVNECNTKNLIVHNDNNKKWGIFTGYLLMATICTTASFLIIKR